MPDGKHLLRRFALVACVGCAPLLAGAQAAGSWIDTFESRVEILALMQTLNAEILAGWSATQRLEQWCRDHRMASDPAIVAHVIAGVNKPAAAEQLQRLEVASGAELKFRQVELRCGSHVFSHADNWYVPARLTPDMNRLLETGDTPFGSVVQALKPTRRTFAVTMLWSPLPAGWEQAPRPRGPSGPARALELPADLFEHRAVLYTSNQPFSEVHERYQRELLAFSKPRNGQGAHREIRESVARRPSTTLSSSGSRLTTRGWGPTASAAPGPV